MFKKLLTLSLSTIMVLGMSTNVFAAETPAFPTDNIFLLEEVGKFLPDIKLTEDVLAKSTDATIRSNSTEIVNTMNKLQKMNIQELNSYINNLNRKSLNAKTRISPATLLELKTAWLAAAQIAKLKGYTCAAKAVEYSILGVNYTENKGAGGLFRDKIVNVPMYKSFLTSFKKSGKSTISQVKEFTKTENSDLFYTLHNATITLKKSGSVYSVQVFDIFDFAPDAKYESIFTSTVNNWVWLCQNTHVLNKVNINVSFNA